MKVILLLGFVAIGLSNPISDVSKFQDWMVKYDVTYSSVEEYAEKLKVFSDNLVMIAKMNEEHIKISGEAVFGVTQFSDLTVDEFKSMYLGAIPPLNDTVPREIPVSNTPNANDIDWRTKDALTPVKNQGHCGSCWAFSATAAVESYAKLSTKYDLIELAAQQIVSCDKADGGCGGGWPYKAYGYLQKAGGMEAEADYPYVSGDSGKVPSCAFNVGKSKVKVTGYKNVAKGESNLETALNAGPASVCVDASSWHSYTGGILSSCGRSVDHCVQAVAYTSDYWVIRNSWKASWGEEGFMRIKRGSDLCLIADYVTYPTF